MPVPGKDYVRRDVLPFHRGLINVIEHYEVCHVLLMDAGLLAGLDDSVRDSPQHRKLDSHAFVALKLSKDHYL